MPTASRGSMRSSDRWVAREGSLLLFPHIWTSSIPSAGEFRGPGGTPIEEETKVTHSHVKSPSAAPGRVHLYWQKPRIDNEVRRFGREGCTVLMWFPRWESRGASAASSCLSVLFCLFLSPGQTHTLSLGASFFSWWLGSAFSCVPICTWISALSLSACCWWWWRRRRRACRVRAPLSPARAPSQAETFVLGRRASNNIEAGEFQVREAPDLSWRLPLV